MTTTKPETPAIETKKQPPPICLEKWDCAAKAELQVEVYAVDFVSYERSRIPAWVFRAIVRLIGWMARTARIKPAVVLRSRLARDGETLATYDDESHPVGCGLALDVWTARPCQLVEIPHALVDVAARRMVYACQPGKN